jgi:formylmethanofuran dehydrogenase subunit B
MRKRRILTDVEFVTAWAKAKTLTDVVAATGLQRISVQARASRLRKAGVRLRRFARSKKKIDVQGLNKIIDKLSERGRPKKTRRSR